MSQAAALQESDLQVAVAHTPAAVPLRLAPEIGTDARGARTVSVGVTNLSDAPVTLQRLTLELPWVALDVARDALVVGGWDMGRTEARVHAPGETGLSTGTYLLARDGDRGFALAGFVTWRTFQSKLSYADGRLRVVADGENRVLKPGETVKLEQLALTRGADWQDLLFGYADRIAAVNAIKLNAPKPFVGWATWDYFGRDWSYQNVVDNLDALLRIWPQADLLQIDGGWWPQRGDYTQVRASLAPEGMKRLATLIRSKGLTAGIHLDGMRGDAKAQVAREHPDFFLKDDRGVMIVDSTIKTGDKLDYTFFDYSNPGACDYMRDALRQIRREWGYDYIKIDFLRFGLNDFIAPIVEAAGGKRIVPFDRGLTSVERFHRGMTAFREGMGPDAYFLACSSVFGPVFGHADGLRSGADINPGFRQFKRCALDTSGNFYLHGVVAYNDADYHVVRAREDQDASLVKSPVKDGKNMTDNEAEMWTHFVALFGGPKLNSDHLPILREKRRALFQLAASIPTSERYVPLDLWQHATSEEDPPAVMLGKHGGTVYLGLFNWSDAAKEFRLEGFAECDLATLAKLGGDGTVRPAGDALSIGLAARHSMIFQIPRSDFDRLRKAIRVR